MIKGIDISLMVGPGVPIPVPRMVVDAIQSVRVEENSGAVQSGFDISFALDKDSPLKPAATRKRSGCSATPIAPFGPKSWKKPGRNCA